MGREQIHAGALAFSVWVWAIGVERCFLYSRTKLGHGSLSSLLGRANRSRTYPRACLPSRRNRWRRVSFCLREWKPPVESQTSPCRPAVRIEKGDERLIAREVERLERRLLVRVDRGSAGPFVACSETSVSSCRGFQSIAASEHTSLAVGAPVIAEALLRPLSCLSLPSRDHFLATSSRPK